MSEFGLECMIFMGVFTSYLMFLTSVCLMQKDVVLGKMPVMLRSRCCVLNGKDETELAKLGLTMHLLYCIIFYLFFGDSCIIELLSFSFQVNAHLILGGILL